MRQLPGFQLSPIHLKTQPALLPTPKETARFPGHGVHMGIQTSSQVSLLPCLPARPQLPQPRLKMKPRSQTLAIP